MNQAKLALPKGRLMPDTSAMLDRARWGLSDYHEGTRSYRLSSQKFPGLAVKVFHEKDIPVQVAVGNYDLGICGLDWVEELLAKYPSAALVKLRDLGYAEGVVYVVAAGDGNRTELDGLRARQDTIRLVSEYPNLAEAYALKLRLRRFSVLPLWGGAEVYPPESADLALISGKMGTSTFNHGLVPVDTVLGYQACLIANRDRWEDNDLSELLASIEDGIVSRSTGNVDLSPPTSYLLSPISYLSPTPGLVRLALPDGHQQAATAALLNKAGIRIEDYPSPTGNRRPSVQDPTGVSVKVIRPQDMPAQVANGNFDLAVTGKDWVEDHLCQFPSSPVMELVDLKSAKVRIVAAVSNDLPVSDGYELRQFWSGRPHAVRVASEYVNIADKYARDNHFGRYRVIPTWGASEAFLPEDADLLIENTETGRTIAQHNLKIIDTLFESTGCLIGNKKGMADPGKSAIMNAIRDALRKGVEAA